VAGPLGRAADLSHHVSDLSSRMERLSGTQVLPAGNSSSRSPSQRSNGGGITPSSSSVTVNDASAAAAASAAGDAAADNSGGDASAWVLDQEVGVQDNLGNLRRAMARLSSNMQPVQLSSVALGRASLIPPPTGRLAAQRPPTPDRCGVAQGFRSKLDVTWP
jgi:hypothetical protein